MGLLAFAAACCLPVLLAWRAGNRAIDGTEVRLRAPQGMRRAEVAPTVQQPVGEAGSHGRGGPFDDALGARRTDE